MEGKTPAESAVVGRHVPIFEGHLNRLGTIYGGYVLELLDGITAQVAIKHAGTMCVTKSVDEMEFLAPISEDDVLIAYASVNRVWTTSLEVGVRLCARKKNEPRRHVVSAYFTFVAIDEVSRKPVPVPPLNPQSSKEKRRYEQANERRMWRLSRRVKRS